MYTQQLSGPLSRYSETRTFCQEYAPSSKMQNSTASRPARMLRNFSGSLFCSPFTQKSSAYVLRYNPYSRAIERISISTNGAFRRKVFFGFPLARHTRTRGFGTPEANNTLLIASGLIASSSTLMIHRAVHEGRRSSKKLKLGSSTTRKARY